MPRGVYDRKKGPTEKVVCPICDRTMSLTSGDTGNIGKHHPVVKRRFITYCGGGGMTVQAAQIKGDLIIKLVREAVVLRQIERGTHLTKAKEPGDVVGSTRRTLNKKEQHYHALALGVDHSVALMRGLPPTDEIED